MLGKLIPALRRYLGHGQLRSRMLRGGVWLGAGTAAAQSFRFLRNIFLVRILSPESFGAMAIVISISSMMDTLTEIGVREAIIQSPNGSRREYLTSALWFSAGRAFISYVLIYLLAPLISHVYRNPELTGLTRVALLGIVFRGVMSPRAFVALKDMDYKRWAILQYGSSIAGTLITIALALAIHNIWALAIGFASEFFILAVASYFLFPFWPDLYIPRRSARELLQFSKGVFGLSFLNLIYLRADVLVLGRMVPAEHLGVYVIAIYLAQVPAAFILNYQAQILMPAFSQLQSDAARTNSILSRSAGMTGLLAIPVAVFVLLSGRTLLSLLYGNTYTAGFWPFLIAIVIAFVNIANAQITTAVYAAGKPQLHRTCLLAMASLMLALIYPAARYLGTAGAQLAALIAIILGYGIQLQQMRSLTGFRLRLDWSRSRQFVGPLMVFCTAILGRSLVVDWRPATNILLGAGAAAIALASGAAVVVHRNRNRWSAVTANS